MELPRPVTAGNASEAPPRVVGDWLAIVVFYRIADMAL